MTMIVPACYREPVRINRMSEVRFDGAGKLAATYLHAPTGAIITNDHNMLYYFTKRWQVLKDLALTGLKYLHFDQHMDLGNPDIIPPGISGAKNKEQLLDAIWRYTKKHVQISEPFVPLVFDGSLSDLFYLRDRGGNTALQHIYSVIGFRCYPGPDPYGSTDERMWFEEKNVVTGLDDSSRIKDLSFHCLGIGTFKALFNRLLGSVPERNFRKIVPISIDADCFMKERPIYGRAAENDEGEARTFLHDEALNNFRRLMEAEKKRLKGTKKFICTSTPGCTHPGVARIVLNAFEGIFS